MKQMTCKELGGACSDVFKANSFEEIASLSQAHGNEMFQKQDPDHLKAMEAMKDLMKDPEAMTRWMDEKRTLFERLPDC